MNQENKETDNDKETLIGLLAAGGVIAGVIFVGAGVASGEGYPTIIGFPLSVLSGAIFWVNLNSSDKV